MNKTEALQITGSLSNPSKMPGKAYGLPAKECKTGSKLPEKYANAASGPQPWLFQRFA